MAGKESASAVLLCNVTFYRDLLEILPQYLEASELSVKLGLS